MSDQEMFDRFLSWLDSERDKAGRKYEDIRCKLIKFFTCRGCMDVEDLADVTIKRVIKKIPEIADSYVGDPALYFYGVARNICMERCKSDRFNLQVVSLPAPPEDPLEEKEQRHECLESCLSLLTPENRKLVLEYYKDDKTAKIKCRKEMADRLGINTNALRIRMHRTRESLQKCVLKCLEATATE